MTIKVEHPDGYMGILYGKSSMSIYDKDGHICLHTGFRTPNTEEELYEVLGNMPKFEEMVAKIKDERIADTPQTDVYDYKGNGKWERSE